MPVDQQRCDVIELASACIDHSLQSIKVTLRKTCQCNVAVVHFRHDGGRRRCRKWGLEGNDRLILCSCRRVSKQELTSWVMCARIKSSLLRYMPRLGTFPMDGRFWLINGCSAGIEWRRLDGRQHINSVLLALSCSRFHCIHDRRIDITAAVMTVMAYLRVGSCSSAYWCIRWDHTVWQCGTRRLCILQKGVAPGKTIEARWTGYAMPRTAHRDVPHIDVRCPDRSGTTLVMHRESRTKAFLLQQNDVVDSIKICRKI